MSLSRRNFLKILSASTVISLTHLSLSAQDESEPTLMNSVLCPVLMYHYISTPPENADAVLTDLAVTPENFAAQLDYLAEAGFTTISMSELWQGLNGEIALPERPIVLTFDDGYQDAYAHATPLMLERGMKGTFYIAGHFMEQPGYLTWQQANEMRGAGMEIGCHSLTHGDMYTMTADEQRVEIEQSTAMIEAASGVRPTTFCYPLGRFNRTTRLLLNEYGYHTAVTTSDATVIYRTNPYRMGRVRIRNRTTVNSLEWLVNRRA